MKRTILVGALALATAAALAFAPDARADASCADGDTVNQAIAIGVVCAGGNADAATGHVYVDGNDANPDPADGYVGANNDDPETPNGAVVGCADGNYQDDNIEVDTDNDGVADSGDGDADPNVIADANDPGAPPDPASPCNPG